MQSETSFPEKSKTAVFIALTVKEILGRFVHTAASDLYAVRFCNRVFKNTDFGCSKGKDDKQKCYYGKSGKSKLWMFATGIFFTETICFINVNDSRAHEKDGDVYPIRRFSYCSVIGIEYYGDQYQTYKRTF